MLIITEDHEAWMAAGLHERLGRRVECELRSAGAIRDEDLGWLVARRLVFVRSRSPRLLRILARVERRGCQVVNRVSAIRRARHRATAIARVASAGVPVARDYEGPLHALPFRRAVLKRRFDNGEAHAVTHAPSTPRERGGARSKAIVYAQEFVASEWEHKLYIVGAEAFAFVQRPTLLDPDARSTRRRVQADPALADSARSAAQALGLEVAGVDFLVGEDGVARVTDINSNQGLHTFAEGFEALEALLLHRYEHAALGMVL
ncbi:MAG: hypothetical protein U0271_26860 [Polyangiaceae bacterium]